MSSSIPPMTPELKSIAPYLQRAEELRYKDPVMAYWSAYYAAQIGISLKAKDTPSRNLLFELLGSLEMMKREIGPNDAVDIEAVSSAYVENFALKVFGMADNEDRKGDANRATAKKFLAAANFLEVLKVFQKIEISESIEEKIRYAKWKAADIAKAYREGRNPTPGPAVSALDYPQSTNASLPQSPPLQNPASSSSPPEHQTPSPPQIKRSSPPPNLAASDMTSANEVHTPPRRLHMLDVPTYGSGLLGMGLGMGLGEPTPGSWSTAATPGTAMGTPMAPVGRPDVGDIEGTVGAAFGWDEPDSPTEKAKGKRRDKAWCGSDSSNESVSAGSGSLGSRGSSTQSKKAWVSGELEGIPQEFYPQDPTIPNPSLDLKAYSIHNHGSPNPPLDGKARKVIHSTPSVVGGLSSGGNTPAVLDGPVINTDASKSTRTPFVSTDVGIGRDGHQRKGSIDSIGSTTSTDVTKRKRTTSLVTPQPETYPDPGDNPTHSFSVPQLPSTGVENVASLTGTFKTDSGFVPPHQPLPPSKPTLSPPPFVPPGPPITYAVNVPRVSPVPIPAPQKEIELTPNLIAKAQKHCRFAISALDYEDAEQARRELRAALAVLGG